MDDRMNPSEERIELDADEEALLAAFRLLLLREDRPPATTIAFLAKMIATFVEAYECRLETQVEGFDGPSRERLAIDHVASALLGAFQLNQIAPLVTRLNGVIDRFQQEAERARQKKAALDKRRPPRGTPEKKGGANPRRSSG